MNPKSFFKIAETWHSCCSRQVNIFVFPDFRETKLLGVCLRGATFSSFVLDFREILEIWGIPRGATCPAALARSGEVVRQFPQLHRR